MDITHVWVAYGSPEDLMVFKTRALAEQWLRESKGYVKRGFVWQHPSVGKDQADEFDIVLERKRIIVAAVSS